LRWPSAWVDPALLGLLEGTPFNCLAMEWNAALAPVVAKAGARGLAVVALGNEAARAAGVGTGLTAPPEDLLIAAHAVWPGITPVNGAELSIPTVGISGLPGCVRHRRPCGWRSNRRRRRG